ncbi:uncharacterized protein [Syngnathus scovelli]|uniref:uncharacterized protein n=1 Tax=Syngnathus scovelli TaxID=161590 RepID=UPI00210F2C5F|nr:uncharacterized protein LOC125974742 [Syngnathus scovelli]
MQASVSVPLEPGPERGAPWGRDLYTFVTSAAGHMMRTLQKPRKNRPSKRQVNHRRFLHNMIQRKFADIEAANRQLASALYLKEVESLTPEQSCDHSDNNKDQSVKQGVKKGTQKKHDTASACPTAEALVHLDDSEEATPISPFFTPLLSPLSFDATDMSVDSPGDANNLVDISESDLEDILDLFSSDDEAARHTGRFHDTKDGDHGCSCHGDDGPIISHLHTNEDFVNSEPLPVLTSCQHKMSLGGVAQSFCAPPLEASLCHIVTPPHEDQLMFTDILMDSELPEYASFNTPCNQDVYAQYKVL